MLGYIKLPYFLSDDQHQQFLSIGENIPDDDWIQHVSSVSGKPMGLNFYNLNMTFAGSKCFLVMMKPNDFIDWHTDGRTRNIALSYPLTTGYAPCQFQTGEKVDTPMFLNTQVKHAVFNNENKRISLNISFLQDLDECVKIFEGMQSHEFMPS